MDKSKQKGAAQPDKVESPNEDPSPARVKDRQREHKPRAEDDMPGADGPLSAGADEDTYD
jgi:hypothetical protein